MKLKTKTPPLIIYALIFLFVALFIQVTFRPDLGLGEFGWWLNGFSLGVLAVLTKPKKR